MSLNIPHVWGDWRITVEKEVGSTNDVCRALAADGAPAGTVVVAEKQTAGRGRRGRSFFSPQDTGLYMSLLLRPDMAAADAASLTAVTAVGAAAALERVTGRTVGIKWVNDLFIDGKKVCGILTEAAMCGGSDRLDFAVVGIGINLGLPCGGFPAELQTVAGAAAPHLGDVRAETACAVLEALAPIYADPAAPQWVAQYRARSVLDGQRVRVAVGGTACTALALGVDEQFGLRIRCDDGTERTLTSGEASAAPI